ncbi:polysaccharide pyruvyl transferase family protein [Micropruina sp.]|uniref:polysaccharide pyruvyl transferase family protein n=1 Tax=Micropruina sp. TaxID=2737536 RepID=UPI0039E5A6A6
MAGQREVFVDFYDYLNLGDDLLFFVLAQRYAHVRFAYAEQHPRPVAFRLPNVRRMPRIPYVDGMLRRLRIPFSLNEACRRRAIRQSRHAVRLGGSLYMERGEWQDNVRRDLALLSSPGGAIYLNGNFGPWRTEGFLATYVRLFSEALDVTVRDNWSFAQLAGVPQLRMAPDLIFSLSSDVRMAERGGVVISLINLDGRPGISEHREAYERAMAELVEDLVKDGQQVTLMSFCAAEGDELAVDRVASLVPSPARGAVTTHYYRGDMRAALTLLQRTETVVATRFHAMVLGLAFGCRVNCVEYSDKVANALDDLGLGHLGWSIEEFVTATRVERHRRATALSVTLADGEDLARRANQHFAVLDQLLAGPPPRTA